MAEPGRYRGPPHPEASRRADTRAHADLRPMAQDWRPVSRDLRRGRWPEVPWSEEAGAYQQGRGYGAFTDDDEAGVSYRAPGTLGIRHGNDVVTSPLPSKLEGRGPRNYFRSDTRIREQVCDALTDHDGVDATDIEVAVQDAHVTLTGSVPEREMKRTAEAAVEACRGVQEVSNLLRVRRAPRA